MPEAIVPQPLRPYVTSIHGYFDRPAPESVHHGLPSPTLTLLIAFDEPLDCGWVATPQQHERHWLGSAGLHTAPALVRSHGYQHGIQLALTPAGSRSLLGVPAAELAGEMVDHQDLPTGITAELHERLAACGDQDGHPDWSGRFRLLTDWLTELVARSEGGGRPDDELTEAWRVLGRTGGGARIGALADYLGWSRRRLLSRFRSEYGVGPKEAARLFRFDRANGLVRQGYRLADVAATCGYVDQPHFTREWTAMTARTPTQVRQAPYFRPVGWDR